MTSIVSAIQKLARAESLDDTLLTASFNALLSGEVPPEQIGAFLMGLAVKGETGKELLAGAKAMRSNARTIKVPGKTLDTCGTGGLGWKSLNTSTTSAIVVAACGGRVAKHGNRSVPPKTGSADVLEALGVSIEMSEERFKACIEEIGVGFLFARSHHPAMRHVAPVRASLGIRTIFNLLGPLSNPAQATHQILGVYDPKWLTPMAEALRDLGVEKAWVVHGISDGNHAIDEISIAGETKIVEVSDGRLHEISLHPEDAGLSRSPLSELEGGAPEENAKAINDLFDGKSTPFSEAVTLNAAAGLYLLDIVDDLTSGVQLANDAILSGNAKEKLSLLVRISNEG